MTSSFKYSYPQSDDGEEFEFTPKYSIVKDARHSQILTRRRICASLPALGIFALCQLSIEYTQSGLVPNDPAISHTSSCVMRAVMIESRINIW